MLVCSYVNDRQPVYVHMAPFLVYVSTQHCITEVRYFFPSVGRPVQQKETVAFGTEDGCVEGVFDRVVSVMVALNEDELTVELLFPLLCLGLGALYATFVTVAAEVPKVVDGVTLLDSFVPVPDELFVHVLCVFERTIAVLDDVAVS